MCDVLLIHNSSWRVSVGLMLSRAGFPLAPLSANTSGGSTWRSTKATRRCNRKPAAIPACSERSSETTSSSAGGQKKTRQDHGYSFLHAHQCLVSEASRARPHTAHLLLYAVSDAVETPEHFGFFGCPLQRARRTNT